MNKILVLSFAVAMVLSATIIMAAGENKQISLQGRLTDAAGKPLSGTYSFHFEIFAGAEGGDALGNPAWSETQTLTVSKGLFSTRIGKTAFPPELKFDVPYYVEIAVNDEPLSPRYVLAASPYTISTPVIPTTFDAGAIISGVFNAARIPALTIDKIPSIPTTKLTGTIADSQIASVAASKITGNVNSLVTALDASKITSSAFDPARIPALDASKITSGCFTAARIPALDAGKITSGTFDPARIPALAASKLTGMIADSQIAAVAASKITGTIADSQIASVAASKITGNVNSLVTALDASKITTGTLDISTRTSGNLPTSRLSGTLDGSKISGSNSIPVAAIPMGITPRHLTLSHLAGTYSYPCGAYDSKTVQVSTYYLSPTTSSCACSVTATAATTGTPPKLWDYICNCVVTANPTDNTKTDITLYPRYVSSDGTARCSGTAFTLTIDWVAIER